MADYDYGGPPGGGGPSSYNLDPSSLAGSSSSVGGGKKRQHSESLDEDTKPSTKEKQGGASEFVKKLYRMLEDANFTDIVSWGYTGDSFVVKDMNSFTRSILPLHFKHSNFASFVRQLNKYDFHKVKNPEEGGSPYGEHTWEFKHPNFRSDMKDSLEHIKRKAPAPRKTAAQPAAGRARANNGPSSASIDPSLPTPSAGPSSGHPSADMHSFQAQLNDMHRTQQAMQQHMTNISQDYQVVMGEMMNFQRNLVAQDQLMQNLIQYLVNIEAEHKGSATDANGNFTPSSQAQKLISSYTEVSRAAQDQMADLSRRASLGGRLPPPPPGFGHFRDERNGQGYDRRDGTPNGNGQGVYRSDGGQQQSHHLLPQPHPHAHAPPHRDQQPSPQQQQQQQSQQGPAFQHPSAPPCISSETPEFPRPTYVPGWAVPPRVLLVEDDAVCRKLSSKFLQVFGCQIDVAEDGVSAVNKMNSAVEKYDLVLMDIVMPNLDGVSATSLIRQFDPSTPIISMTSNSGPNDIMTYFSHGMNDILPKPFTKEGLLGMLEKHLIHLKVMQQLSEIPRALGFTDNQIQDALAVSATDQGNVMNPFSAMGISDQDYLGLLQGIALEKEGKRGLEVVQGNEREGKRARFLLGEEQGRLIEQ